MPEMLFCYCCRVHHPREQMRLFQTRHGPRWRCLRSIAEITEWGRADDGRKRAILHEVARRKAAAAAASADPRSPS